MAEIIQQFSGMRAKSAILSQAWDCCLGLASVDLLSEEMQAALSQIGRVDFGLRQLYFVFR